MTDKMKMSICGFAVGWSIAGIALYEGYLVGTIAGFLLILVGWKVGMWWTTK